MSVLAASAKSGYRPYAKACEGRQILTRAARSVEAMEATLGMLAGLKVLDLGTALAAPYSAMLLGDLGAEVVKVEKPRRGDMIRATDSYVRGESGHFLG